MLAYLFLSGDKPQTRLTDTRACTNNNNNNLSLREQDFPVMSAWLSDPTPPSSHCMLIPLYSYFQLFLTPFQPPSNLPSLWLCVSVMSMLDFDAKAFRIPNGTLLPI